jgi:hypothetical protein
MSIEHFQTLWMVIFGILLFFGGYKAMKEKSFTIRLGSGRGIIPMKIEGIVAQLLGGLFMINGLISFSLIVFSIFNINYNLDFLLNVFILVFFMAVLGGFILQSIINLKDIISNLLNKKE